MSCLLQIAWQKRKKKSTFHILFAKSSQKPNCNNNILCFFRGVMCWIILGQRQGLPRVSTCCLATYLLRWDMCGIINIFKNNTLYKINPHTIHQCVSPGLWGLKFSCNAFPQQYLSSGSLSLNCT